MKKKTWLFLDGFGMVVYTMEYTPGDTFQGVIDEWEALIKDEEYDPGVVQVALVYNYKED